MNIGPMEIVIVLVLALLVFGPKRLPQAGRSLGQAMRELRRVTSSARADLGLDDVASDMQDLKSSMSIDLNAPPDAKSPTVDDGLRQRAEASADTAAPVPDGRRGNRDRPDGDSP